MNRPLTVLGALCITLVACKAREPEPRVDTSATAIAPTETILQFQQQTNLRLDSLETRLTQLRDSAKTLKDAARERANKAIDNLQSDLQTVRERVRAATYDTQDAWDRFTAEIDSTIGELGRKCDLALR